MDKASNTADVYRIKRKLGSLHAAQLKILSEIRSGTHYGVLRDRERNPST